MGDPFSECLRNGAEVWEREYRDMLKTCESSDPIDVLNYAIDMTLHRFVEHGQEKAQATLEKLSHADAEAYEYFGFFTMLGSLSHVVFAYAPAVANVLKVDPDRVCFDTVECIQKSVKKRGGEMHPSYAEGARIVLSAFLASLFGEK
jgi:hypothetical protein